jgi:hypothetical protein
MSRRPDDNDRLESLLRMLPAPEPSAQLVVSARRRYLEAMAGRARREALMGLLAALIGLAVLVALGMTVSEPATLVVWPAETVADIARWTAGIGVVISLVPPVGWASVILGSAATLLSLALVTRARAVATAK